MTMPQDEFEEILADDTKEISEDIVWVEDPDHSSAQEFRAEVTSGSGYSIFINGRYSPLSGKLSYSMIHRGTGRIYGLDLGADHRNPDGVRVGEKHKNSWRDGARDKWAYVPEDITSPWDRPVEVWEQFCAEANLRHSGTMSQPVVQMDMPL